MRNWYYSTEKDVINSDGDMMVAFDVQTQEVGVLGVFYDRPANLTLLRKFVGL